jgi:hypothetical protein
LSCRRAAAPPYTRLVRLTVATSLVDLIARAATDAPPDGREAMASVGNDHVRLSRHVRAPIITTEADGHHLQRDIANALGSQLAIVT